MKSETIITRENSDVLIVTVYIDTEYIREDTSILINGELKRINKPLLSKLYGLLTDAEVVLVRKSILEQLKKEFEL